MTARGLVHGFPDTPHTWRHLGPVLVERGYRVVAPWLPGYDTRRSTSTSAWAPTCAISSTSAANTRQTIEQSLIGHDWGAHAGYGVVAIDPKAFSRLSLWRFRPRRHWRRHLPLPPAQAVVLHLVHPAGRPRRSRAGRTRFWESLWADWSPGYDPSDDVAELRETSRPTVSPTSSAPIAPRSTRSSPIPRRTPRKRRRCSRAGADAVPHGADAAAWGQICSVSSMRGTYPRAVQSSKSSTASATSSTWRSPSYRGQNRRLARPLTGSLNHAAGATVEGQRRGAARRGLAGLPPPIM